MDETYKLETLCLLHMVLIKTLLLQSAQLLDVSSKLLQSKTECEGLSVGV